MKIKTKNNEVTDLEYLTGNQPVPPTINTAVPYFIDNHTPVRRNEGEGGIMTLAGDRVEIREGAVINYCMHISNNISNEELSKVYLCDSGIDFDVYY